MKKTATDLKAEANRNLRGLQERDWYADLACYLTLFTLGVITFHALRLLHILP